MQTLKKSFDRRDWRERSHLWLAGGALSAVVAFFVLMWVWDRGAEQRAVRGMPPAERAALYRRTFDDLRSVCDGRVASELSDHCERQARFILLFPECDDACERLAHGLLPLR